MSPCWLAGPLENNDFTARVCTAGPEGPVGALPTHITLLRQSTPHSQNTAQAEHKNVLKGHGLCVYEGEGVGESMCVHMGYVIVNVFMIFV